MQTLDCEKVLCCLDYSVSNSNVCERADKDAHFQSGIFIAKTLGTM